MSYRLPRPQGMSMRLKQRDPSFDETNIMGQVRFISLKNMSTRFQRSLIVTDVWGREEVDI